jgi:hypothetical protein
MRDIDGPEGPCDICGQSIDNCKCPECHTCGDVGCITHMSLNCLAELMENLSVRLGNLQSEYKRRQTAKVESCPGCGDKLLPDLIEGGPAYCNRCKKDVWKGRFVDTD